MSGELELMNEETGEVVTLADYLAQQREIEREITRLDAAIDTHKECLKAAKDGKDKAVRDLRASIRESKMLDAAKRAGRKKTRTALRRKAAK
jgi:predicted RNA-binding protein